MPLYTKIVGLVAGGVAVAVFGSTIIGANYSGAVLHHLVDTTNGTTTATAVVPNAPNWAYGQPLPTPYISSTATSSHANAASGLASSTSYTFQVAAIGLNGGTTTLSSPATVTTDASTTQPRPEDIIIKWAAVPGTAGYAVYFATSSAITAANSQYFYSTTTGQYDFSTSTGSLAGYYAGTDSTAFRTLLSPTGTSYIAGGSDTSTSTALASSSALEVTGSIRVQQKATTTNEVNCYAAINGQMFFNAANGHLWICEGAGPTWTLVK